MDPMLAIDTMFAFFKDHEYMPCEGCGASLGRAERATHVCEEARKFEYELLHILEQELRGFDQKLAAYLDSPVGRFAAYYAARQRAA